MNRYDWLSTISTGANWKFVNEKGLYEDRWVQNLIKEINTIHIYKQSPVMVKEKDPPLYKTATKIRKTYIKFKLKCKRAI